MIERATICPECGSGILDGEHIADYPCPAPAVSADTRLIEEAKDAWGRAKRQVLNDQGEILYDDEGLYALIAAGNALDALAAVRGGKPA